MASASPTGAQRHEWENLFGSLLHGERGRALRTQLAARYPSASPDAIEDAVQHACKSFLDQGEDISARGQLYTWIRTVAEQSLGREADRRLREIAVDPGKEGLERISTEGAGPAEELIALEDGADLEMLVEKVSSSLPETGRDVLALYGSGLKRPQIADHLGVPEREVKEHLRIIMDRTRSVVATLAGGGCRAISRQRLGPAAPGSVERCNGRDGAGTGVSEIDLARLLGGAKEKSAREPAELCRAPRYRLGARREAAGCRAFVQGADPDPSPWQESLSGEGDDA